MADQIDEKRLVAHVSGVWCGQRVSAVTGAVHELVWVLSIMPRPTYPSVFGGSQPSLDSAGSGKRRAR